VNPRDCTEKHHEVSWIVEPRAVTME
jgi:hypothetical protein